MIVLIHYVLLLNDRDFLFEFIMIIMLLYTYFVDNSFHFIIARNDIN